MIFSVTVQDCYPIPLLQECIDALERCRYFTTLDIASGYYQLKVAEEDGDKTAFVTKYGLFSLFVECYLWCVMLQQLSVVRFPWY